MRTWTRYIVLLIIVTAGSTLLYLSFSNGNENDIETVQENKHEIWDSQHQQAQPIGGGHHDQEGGHAGKQREGFFSQFANIPRWKKRDHAWNGLAFANEVEQHRAAYSRRPSSKSPFLDQMRCTPRHNITFLKVHKTGSSTLQNIFLRYGQRHKLTFVLPPQGHHLGFPDFFDRHHMLPVENGIYNIFCHHARFSQVVMDIMPPNSIYISILRDPVHVFESAFTYFKIAPRINMGNDADAMAKFLEDPVTYYESAPSTVHMRNNMLYDFGVPTIKFDDTDFIEEAIQLIDKQFSLILIAEYFEESLILLRDALCWRTEDMVVFKMNTRKKTAVDTLGTDLQSKIRTWNSGDTLLYDHFNKTLWHKIEQYGTERMAREVKELRALTESYYKLCIKTDTADRKEGVFDVWQPPGVKINAFVLKESASHNPICENMVRPEIVYTAQLREAQFPNRSFRKFQRNWRRRRPPVI
ncbi:galactosylceramide sulfotransferase-like [Acanthaster planci]|uniref:Galactosylceramide sulfotransferase-like n=1 Tax=Acanthaster planci TaxID=133434 RepID=A0A8B7XF41_ACAPL|nr:galactosylceramide sulfotransferase-like [Acanthaster planci]